MTRKIKAIGALALVLLAVGAFSAGAASASNFWAEENHAELRGEQHSWEDEFTFNAGTLRCNRATYTGTQVYAITETARLTPAFSECKAFGFVNTTVDTEGCEYVLETGYEIENTSGTMEIQCPVFKQITVTAFNCWVTIGSQNLNWGITFTKQGSGSSRDLTVDMYFPFVSYTQHSKSFPGCSNGTFNNGTLSSSQTLKAFNTSGTQIGIWVY